MHNAGFKKVGADLRYFALEPQNIGNAMEAIKALGFEGVSVSKPYKEEVIQYLDEVDAIAEKIGAVNVVHNCEGKLKGFNSDWIGAIGALEEKTELKGKSVYVIGAGGASRAVVYGLTLKGALVTVYNRTKDRGMALANDIGVNWGGSFDRISEDEKPNILVNATPLGRTSPKETPLPGYDLDGVELVMDINVQKDDSRLLVDAKRCGCETIGGVRMLVLQGVFAFELFSKQKAPVDTMQTAVINAMR